MEDNCLDFVLVPLGIVILGLYHCWLLITIVRHPERTVVGLNMCSRHRWVRHMMSDPQRNGILAVQSIRNNLMASTVLATIAITLSSLISAVVSNASSSDKLSTLSYTIHKCRYFSVLICFLTAFFCNMQSTRYYAHVSLLVNVPASKGRDEFVEKVAQNFTQGGLFWSLGLRAFYFAFPLLLWSFGPIPMFVCSCLMTFVLYFLDMVSCHSYLQDGFVHLDADEVDARSYRSSSFTETVRSGDSNLSCSLLAST